MVIILRAPLPPRAEAALRICGEEHLQDRPEACPVVVLRISES